jgi:hypothetical protein
MLAPASSLILANDLARWEKLFYIPAGLTPVAAFPWRPAHWIRLARLECTLFIEDGMNARRTIRLRLSNLELRITPATPTTWSPRGAGGGGALFAPSFGWSDPEQINISSDMSQLFRSTDGGMSWNMVNAMQLQGNHNARVISTSDPTIQYCIDYSNVAGYDLQRPSKSTDGGATWTPLAGDPTSGGTYSLYADPVNPNVVVISSYTTLYVSTNGGASFASRYTNSNGLHLGGAFFDGANIYIGSSAGLLTSTNGGSSFALASVGGLPANEAIVSFSGSKQSGTTRLFAVTLGSSDVYPGVTGADFSTYRGVYVLDIGQPNWVKKVTGIATGHFPFFVGAAVNDINTVYVGGGSNAGAPVVYKSTNGGNSWSSVLLTTNNQNVQTGWSGHGGDRSWGYGEYVLGLAVAPQDSARVIITDLGFAHLTTNGGTSWRAVYVQPPDLNPAGASTPTGKAYHSSGLDNTTSWSLTWANPNVMILGNSDVRGQRSTDGGQTWGFGYSGHTFNSMYRSLKHPTSGILYAATSTIHDLYQSTYLTDARIDVASSDGEVRFSTNDGATWQLLHDFNDPVVWVAHDPTNANRLYASVVHSTQGGIFVSNNINAGAASTWTKLTNPPRTEGHPFNIVVLNDGTLVVSYSGRRNSSGAFTASSGVFVSTDGGTSWIDRSHPGMLYWTKDVVVDPHDPTQNTWYVGVFSGWGGPPNGLGGLYRTTNRGQSWTKVNSLDRVTSITIHPTKPNEAYLTTETNGLWHTTNLGAAPTFTRVTSYPFRQPERVFFNPHNVDEVWVTSFGGGLMVGIEDQPPAVAGTQVNDGQAQRSQVTSLTVSFNEAVAVAANAFVLTGPSGAVSYTQTVLSPTQVRLDFAALADGVYSLNLAAGNVTDASNQNLTAHYSFSFHRLFGDADGNGSITAADFSAFRLAYGTTGPSWFDFDHDGQVSAADFNQFRLRYGVTLVP